MSDLSKGERTPRSEHIEKAKALAEAIGRTTGLTGPALQQHIDTVHPLLIPNMQQLADQNADIGEALYALENRLDGDTSQDWATIARTYINALDTGRFPFPPAA